MRFFVVFLLVLIAFGSFSLVILYNKYVNLTYSARTAKQQISDIEIQKTEAQNKIFALVASVRSASIADGTLTQEKAPQYFEVDPVNPVASAQWSSDSRY